MYVYVHVCMWVCGFYLLNTDIPFPMMLSLVQVLHFFKFLIYIYIYVGVCVRVNPFRTMSFLCVWLYNGDRFIHPLIPTYLPMRFSFTRHEMHNHRKMPSVSSHNAVISAISSVPQSIPDHSFSHVEEVSRGDSHSRIAELEDEV